MGKHKADFKWSTEQMDTKVEKGYVQQDYEPSSWGKSLHVASVQEIVRNGIKEYLPERFIQEHKNRPANSELLSPASSEVPIINFTLLTHGDEAELTKLDNACKEWGFFQMINHGIAETVILNMKAVTAAFFELPLDEKNKYAVADDDIQGYGKTGTILENQKLDWYDNLYLRTLPPNTRKMKHWPCTVPGFKEALEEYATETQRVADELLAKLSLLMGMDRDSLKMLHGETMQSMSLNIYPPCSRPDLVIGISPHSDADTISLLVQDDDVTALQIKHEDKWVPVKPIPGAIVVNIGDVVEIWSNGVYKSIEHRVVVNEKKARLAVAMFVSPDEEVEIGPLESMVSDDRPRLYRSIKYLDYILRSFSVKGDGKNHTEFLKLEDA